MDGVLRLVKAEDWEGALTALRPIFKADPDNPKVSLVLGLCNYKLASYEAAAKAYRKALPLLQALLGLASVHEATGDHTARLEVLNTVVAQLREGGAATHEKLLAMTCDRARLCVRLERYAEACNDFAELNQARLLPEWCRALELRQDQLARDAITATVASKFDSKTQAAKEAEIWQMTALPPDLQRCYVRVLGDEGRAIAITPAERRAFRARFLWAMWLVSANDALFWQLLAEAVAPSDAAEDVSEEDWRVYEIALLLGSVADEFAAASPARLAELRRDFVRRFGERALARLATVSDLPDATLEQCNAALLKEPRFVPGWLALLRLYEKAASWRYVEVASHKALDQVDALSKRFGLRYTRVTADLWCIKARAVAPAAKDACWEAALRVRPGHVEATSELAQSHYGRGDAARALATLHTIDADVRHSVERVCVLEAQLLLHAGHANDAVSLLRSCEARFATSAPLHFWLARALWEAGQRGREDCKFQLLVAARLDPRNGETFAWLGSWFDSQGDKRMARRSHAHAFQLDSSLLASALYVSDALTGVDAMAAARLHSRVLEVAPVCKWAAQRLGAFFLNTGKAVNALGAFQSALRADVSDCSAWDGLGDAYRAQGKFFASINAYKQSIERDATRYFPLFRSGSVLRELGMPDQALERLQRANKLRPHFVPVLHEMVLAHVALAERFARLGLPHRGSAELEAALPLANEVAQLAGYHKPVLDCTLLAAKLLAPEHPARPALLQLASAAAQHGGRGGGGVDLAVCGWYLGDERSLDRLAGASATYESLLVAGAILLQRGQFALAHRCFVQAAALDPRSSKPLLMLGVLFLVGGRHALAHRAYARAVALEPDLPEAWAGQGVLNELLGGAPRLAEARMLYGSVAALRADLYEANLGLGRAALAYGDAFQAELGLRRALARNPGSVDGRYLLALAFELQGRVQLSEGLLRGLVAQLGAAAANASEPPRSEGSDGGATLVMASERAAVWTPAQQLRTVKAALGRVLALASRWDESYALLSSLQSLSCDETALLAYAALQLGRIDEAITLFARAASQAPATGGTADRLQVLLCRAYVAAKRWDDAVTAARRLIAVRPTVLAALGARLRRPELLQEAVAPAVVWHDAGARLVWKARLEQLAGRADEAFSSFQRAIREDPSRAASWSALAEFSRAHHPVGVFRIARVAGGESLGHLLSCAGKYPKASSLALTEEVRSILQRRVHAQPDHASAWASLAWVQFTYAHVTGAAEAWRQALALLSRIAQPSAAVACALSECHLQLRNVVGAAAVLATTHANDAHVLRARARIALYSGAAKEALRLYSQAVAAQPDFLESWVEMSEIFLQARNFDAAQLCLESAPRQQSAAVSLRLLSVLLAARKEDEAKALANRIHETMPRDSFGGNLVLGNLALRFGSVKAAARRLARAAESDPTAPVVHELLALCRKGDNAAMAAELRADIAVCNVVDALPAMRALARMGEDPLALQRCIHLDPSQIPLWKELKPAK